MDRHRFVAALATLAGFASAGLVGLAVSDGAKAQTGPS